AAGGVVGEAWMSGMLAGIEDAGGVDFRRAETLVGTSAGAIVAARLSAGRPPRRPERADGAGGPDPAEPAAPTSRSALGAAGRLAVRAAWGVTAPFATAALAAGAPAGALTRSLLLARVPGGRGSLADVSRLVERHGARFDGRLRVVAVDRASGRRVVFGAPGGPPATVGAAVAASCSVPWIFEPVRIGGREYVDGGVWSLTNLDVAPAGRDTEILCLSVTHSLPLALRDPLSALRAAAAVATAAEMHALARRGARVDIVGPDAGSAAAIGGQLMDRARAAGALAAGYRQGRAVVTARA
ncbi:MAG TPA: patatin-like phospholipase family protein, partial [Solirubrobacter sp.]|nr:patatin-like phospholipase family protein [Solirubrobacter sp.]